MSRSSIGGRGSGGLKGSRPRRFTASAMALEAGTPSADSIASRIFFSILTPQGSSMDSISRSISSCVQQTMPAYGG